MSSAANSEQVLENGEAWSTLELNYKRFTELPTFITGEPYARCIQRLYLKRNFLVSLPDNVDKIINLVLLYIPSNNLKTLPENLGNLQNLECLNVDSNQLTSLPASIGELKSLRKLQASRNDLSQLPNTIGRLANLTTLELMFNKLPKLPREIGHLHSLEVLNVDSNNIEILPKELCQLDHLLELSVCSNKLLYLPPGNNNNIEVLPKELCQLDHLLELSVCSNKLLYLPPGLTWMKKLTYLIVDNNRTLSCVPSCPQIAELGVTGCGVSYFQPRVLHDYLYITIKSNSYHGNPVILFSPGIQNIGNKDSGSVPILKELCLRTIYGCVKHLAGTPEPRCDLEKCLPKYLTTILQEPYTLCSHCQREVFVMAYPIVHLGGRSSGRIMMIDLCCTLTCVMKYYKSKKSDFSFIYPEFTY